MKDLFYKLRLSYSLSMSWERHNFSNLSSYFDQMKGRWISLLGMILFGIVSEGFGQNFDKRSIVAIGNLENPNLPLELYEKLVTQSPGEIIDILVLGFGDQKKIEPNSSDQTFLANLAELSKKLSPSGGSVFLIPGVQNWEFGKSEGYNSILKIQRQIDSLQLTNLKWAVRDACPGPEEFPLDDDHLLVFLDTQWLIHPYDRGDENSSCETKSPAEVILALRDIFLRNDEKKIIVAMYHPLWSVGESSGVFGIKDHIFPTTHLIPWLYLPLPIIGSAYPAYRSFLGGVKDQAHPAYKSWVDSFRESVRAHPNVVMISALDRSLQYSNIDECAIIMTNSSRASGSIKKSPFNKFSSVVPGWTKLTLEQEKPIQLSFFQIGREEPVFESELPLRTRPKQLSEEDIRDINLDKDSVLTPMSYRYISNRSNEHFFGKNYRNEWSTAVKIPVFRLSEAGNSYTILKRGGGMQTKSLRLKNHQDQQEYVLRSIEKYPEAAIPAALKRTIAKEIVQDQISASNPYAPLVLPVLAEAAGVGHLDPKIVWVPDDPDLGIYRAEFGQNSYLMERRFPLIPSGIENAKAYTTDKVIENLLEDNDNTIDQTQALRSRIFDLFIGDWDRHDDQWVWIGIKEKGGRRFSPVPRDRDQAFFVNEGILPKIASRNWIMPKLQGFDYELKNVNGFMFNGRYFDRNFLNQLDKPHWEHTLDEILSNLSEAVIDSSLTKLPKEIQLLSADQIRNKLLQRKTWLKEKSLEYYSFLSKEVDIPGTHKNEEFHLTHFPDGKLELNMRKISKSGKLEQILYHRIFDPSETKEIRLYGIGGNDVFRLTGTGPGVIKVRVLSGDSPDLIQDDANLLKKSHIIYQYTGAPDSVSMLSSSKIINSSDKNIFLYNRKEFKYEVLSPLPSLEFNPDDGLYLGAGLKWTKQGFRKEPFKSEQVLKGNAALLTGAFNFYYTGRFVDIWKKWDLELAADVRAPNYVTNFFGFGNETEGLSSVENDLDFFRARYNQIRMYSGLRKELGPNSFLRIGPIAEYLSMDESDNSGRFIASPESGLDQIELNRAKTYSGILGRIELDRKNHKQLPTLGFQFLAEAKGLTGLNEFSRPSLQLSSGISGYWTFSKNSRFTWASRLGGGYTFGDYEFFQAQTLGGSANLRGYRRSRFSGDAIFYSNTDLRIRLFDLKTYLFPASGGILGFYDVGRVWHSTKSSDLWHSGKGFGFWIAPLNQLVIAGTMGFGEENLFSVTFGFQY